MKDNKGNNYEVTVISGQVNHERRNFLKKIGILGGGLVVYCTIGDPLKSSAQFGGPPPDFNAFIRIGTDESV
ncbi:hypothetical protein ACFL1N_16150, partial [Thermodesulfobacteriota bacterium]